MKPGKTYYNADGKRIKIIKMQFGFQCPLCGLIIPVRNLLAKFATCPGCSHRESLTGKFSPRGLMNLGNPVLNAIDCGLANRKEYSGFQGMKVDVSPYHWCCPKCKKDFEPDDLSKKDSIECKKCHHQYTYHQLAEIEKKNIHPLIEAILTENISPASGINRQPDAIALLCSQCGAPLEITAEDGMVACRYCGTKTLLPVKHKPEQNDFKRSEMLFIIDVSVENIIQANEMRKAKLSKIDVRWDIVLPHLEFNDLELDRLRSAGFKF